MNKNYTLENILNLKTYKNNNIKHLVKAHLPLAQITYLDEQNEIKLKEGFCYKYIIADSQGSLLLIIFYIKLV